MTFQIEQKNAQALLDYLQKRPYNEVFQLIPLLVGLQPVPEEEEENPSEGEPVAEEATERAPDTEKTPRGKKKQ